MTTSVTKDGVVYRATNLVNGKCYIGVTRRGMRVREKQHRATAARGHAYRAGLKFIWLENSE